MFQKEVELVFVDLSMFLYSFEIVNEPLYWVDSIFNIDLWDHCGETTMDQYLDQTFYREHTELFLKTLDLY